MRRKKLIFIEKLYMPFGICLQNYIPLRAEPSEKSEMISQVLYGETVEILETNKKTGFSKVVMLFDKYEGWLDSKTIYPCDEETHQRINSLVEFVLSDIQNVLSLNNNTNLIIGAGSSLWRKKDIIVYPENVLSVETKNENVSGTIRERLVHSTIKWLNIPYLWGGRSSCGVDCSGFVQNIFKQVGIKLPRDAYQQAEMGNNINFHTEAQAGDLAFFDDDEGQIKHVGILLSSSKIIHSSGMVKIDKIDQNGIFSDTITAYTHKLRLVKDIVSI